MPPNSARDLRRSRELDFPWDSGSKWGISEDPVASRSEGFFRDRKSFLVMSNLSLGGHLCSSPSQDTAPENGFPDPAPKVWIPNPVPDAACVSGRNAPAFRQRCCCKTVVDMGPWQTHPLAQGFLLGGTSSEPS